MVRYSPQLTLVTATDYAHTTLANRNGILHVSLQFSCSVSGRWLTWLRWLSTLVTLNILHLLFTMLSVRPLTVSPQENHLFTAAPDQQ